MKKITLEMLKGELPNVYKGTLSSDTFYTNCIKFLVQHPDVSVRTLSKKLDIPRTTMRRNLANAGYNNEMREQYTEMDSNEQDHFIKLLQQNQRNADKMRVERTNFRKKVRLTNSLEEYTARLIDVYKEHNLSSGVIQHPTNPAKPTGVVHLSDLHINEQINLAHNKFNVKVASQRIQKHIDHAKKVFKAYGVTDVVVAFTGDLMNSDRRLDELLLNATNRANATFVAVDILQQALLDLNKDFNVTCANVTGNESRIGKDVGWINDIAQDNFDFMIYNTLAYIFAGNDGVKFLPPDDTYLEKVVTIGSTNILLIHGHNGMAHDTEKKMATKIGQYAQRGIIIRYILCGHIHCAIVSDNFARSSGLPGDNNYSYNALNLTGRASQNFYMVDPDGSIHGMKVDLQTVQGYSGYPTKNLSIYD